MAKKAKTLELVVAGPYIAKKDGVYFSFPHGSDQIVAVSVDSPEHLANMLNFSILKGFEMMMSEEISNGRARPKHEPMNSPAPGNCPWCGDAMVLVGKIKLSRYCGPCSRAYAMGYGLNLRKSLHFRKDKEVRAFIKRNPNHASLDKARKSAIKGGAQAREKDIKTRGLKVLQTARHLL